MQPAARGLDAAFDPAARDRFAGDASEGIHRVSIAHLAVFIRHPCHFALARAHIGGGGNVAARMDQRTAGELLGEAAGDAFQLVLGPFRRIDPQRTFGAAEGHVDQRAFEAHQRSEGFDLLQIGIRA